MLVRMADGRSSFLDYREVAPGKATGNMYIKPDGKLDPELSVIGYKSVAVPGTVAGLELALKTYGTMKLPDVMAPAIRLAENGYPVSAKLAHEFQEEKRDLQKFSVSNRIFLKNGEMYTAGDTFRQPELAVTLKRIAKNGAAEFYRGETARMLVQDMAALGGLIELDDLAQYQPKVRPVIRAKYEFDGHKWEVLSSPPLSSGGIAIIEALNMLRNVPLKAGTTRKRAHGFRNHAPRIRRPCRLSRRSRFLKCAGGWFDQRLLRQRTRRHHRPQARHLKCHGSCRRTARLRRGGQQRRSSRDQFE
jgi:gamma-glutamyltranspeptidase/glutathione hydrolase